MAHFKLRDEHEDPVVDEASPPSDDSPADEDVEVDDMAEVEEDGLSTDGILAYGIVAEVLTILPLVLILIGAGDSTYGAYSQKYMENTVAAWAPFAILFWIQFAEDNEWIRLAMTGALMKAHSGAWSGMWSGWYVFLMSCESAGTCGMGMNWLFAIIYPCINVGLIVMQWFVGKDVMKWINEAPHGHLQGSGDDEGDEGDDIGDDMEDGADDIVDEIDDATLGRFW